MNARLQNGNGAWPQFAAQTVYPHLAGQARHA